MGYMLYNYNEFLYYINCLVATELQDIVLKCKTIELTNNFAII